MPLLETKASASAMAYGMNSSSSSDLILYLDAGNASSYPGSGTTWSDLSPLSRPLSFYTTPSYSSSNGGFINFQGDAVKNFAENSSTPAYNVDNVTVEIWTKLNTSTTQSGFWIEKGLVNTQYAAFMEGTDLRWRLGTDAFPGATPTSSYLSVNTWAQIVFTHTPNVQQFYKNGSLMFSTTTTRSLAKLDDHGFTVGAWRNDTAAASVSNHGYYIDAGISIIRVYNKVLTSTEITANFNQFRSRYGL